LNQLSKTPLKVYKSTSLQVYKSTSLHMIIQNT